MTDGPTVLLLAHQADIPTQVLYALRSAGYRVAMMGGRWTTHFRHSRHVVAFEEAELTFDEALTDAVPIAAAIDAAALRVGASLVVPGDWISTPILCAALPHLKVATFPIPSLDVCLQLADKAKFADLARHAGLPIPHTIVFDGKAKLDAAVIAEGPGFPAMVKPAFGGGGHDVKRVDTAEEVAAIASSADYSDGPVIVQSFIEGDDIDCSILVREGRLDASAVQQNRDGVLHFLHDDELAQTCARMVAAAGFDGIAHFDARRAASDGRLYLIECNPRPWRSINAAELCGLNFIAMGLAPPPAVPRVLAGRSFANPRQIVGALLKGSLKLRDLAPSLANALRPLFDLRRWREEKRLHRAWEVWARQARQDRIDKA